MATSMKSSEESSMESSMELLNGAWSMKASEQPSKELVSSRTRN